MTIEILQFFMFFFYWSVKILQVIACNRQINSFSKTIYAVTFSTHTHLTALFLGLPRWAGTRKVKPIWILLKQETVSGSGISWTTCKPAPRSRQITPPLSFHRSDACRATNSVKALKAESTEGRQIWCQTDIQYVQSPYTIQCPSQIRSAIVLCQWWVCFLQEAFLITQSVLSITQQFSNIQHQSASSISCCNGKVVSSFAMKNISIKPFPGKPRISIHLLFCFTRFDRAHLGISADFHWLDVLPVHSIKLIVFLVLTTWWLTRMDQHYSDKEKAEILGCKCLPGLHVWLYEY